MGLGVIALPAAQSNRPSSVFGQYVSSRQVFGTGPVGHCPVGRPVIF